MGAESLGLALTSQHVFKHYPLCLQQVLSDTDTFTKHPSFSQYREGEWSFPEQSHTVNCLSCVDHRTSTDFIGSTLFLSTYIFTSHFSLSSHITSTQIALTYCLSVTGACPSVVLLWNIYHLLKIFSNTKEYDPNHLPL